MDQKKLKIAYHEAGHAVMALICGQGVESVSLREMASPIGTDKYLGATKLEPFEQKAAITINELVRRVMISLGGYASEILMLDGSACIGGDDLTSAIKWVEAMMQSEEFRGMAARLPIPAPGALDMIENPMVRSIIDQQMHLAVDRLAPFRPAIQLVAQNLCERDELTGGQAVELFSSFVRSNQQAR